MGARAIGVDFSPRAIDFARDLAQQLGLDTHFLCSDVLQLAGRLDRTFDIVFTSYGVIDWLPDLDAWAEVVASALAPGGSFYMVEFHPLLHTLDDDGGMNEDYFRPETPQTYLEHGSYADPQAAFEGKSHVWHHTLGEVVSAIAGAELKIEYLHEFPYSPYDCFPFTELVEPGRAVLKGRRDQALPLLFSLLAHKEGADSGTRAARGLSGGSRRTSGAAGR